MPPEDSAALSVAVGIVCEMRRAQTQAADVDSQRVRLTIALERHYHSYAQIVEACEQALQRWDRVRLGRFLERITAELEPHEAEIARFLKEHTARPTEVPGLSKFRIGLGLIRSYTRGYDSAQVRRGMLHIEAGREQLAALLEDLYSIRGNDGNEGSAGAGTPSGAPTPPGGLDADNRRSFPDKRSDDINRT